MKNKFLIEALTFVCVSGISISIIFGFLGGISYLGNLSYVSTSSARIEAFRQDYPNVPFELRAMLTMEAIAINQEIAEMKQKRTHFLGFLTPSKWDEIQPIEINTGTTNTGGPINIQKFFNP